MRRLLTLSCLALAAGSLAAEAPLVERVTIHATSAVSVSIPAASAPRGPIYRATDGEWKPLAVAATEGRVAFTLPADAVGSTTVILAPPAWLTMEDEDAPVVESLALDGKVAAVGVDMDFGHFTKSPTTVALSLRDAASPVDVGAARVALDGGLLAPDSVAAAPAEGDPRTRSVTVALPPVSDGLHTLTLRIPDAAPIAHFAEVALRFHSGPLVKDGSFEQLNPDGTPAFWQTARWSEDATTSAELRIAEGGRTGAHCAELLGLAGPLNLVFAQRIPLTPGRKYVARGFYQSSSPNAFVSIISDAQGGVEQYDSLPSLQPAEDWTPFEFRFMAKPSTGYTLYLRNGGKGSVKWDDVEVDEGG